MFGDLDLTCASDSYLCRAHDRRVHFDDVHAKKEFLCPSQLNMYILLCPASKSLVWWPGGGTVASYCLPATPLPSTYTLRKELRPFAFTMPHDFRVFTKDYS